MTAFSSLVRNEGRLVRRDLGALLPPLLLPLVLLAVWSAVPDMRAPSDEYGGLTGLEALIAPIALAIVVATIGLSVVPVTLAGYREKGILRRLAVTPVGPVKLLSAQLVVSVALAAAGIVLGLTVAAAVFGVELPRNGGGFALGLLLGTVTMFSIGLLVAALAPTGRAANGIGMALFFAMMILGGFFVPSELLPEWVQTVGSFTPAGALLEILRGTWAGAAAAPLQLAVLAGYAVVSGGLAARFFRWS